MALLCKTVGDRLTLLISRLKSFNKAPAAAALLQNCKERKRKKKRKKKKEKEKKGFNKAAAAGSNTAKLQRKRKRKEIKSFNKAPAPPAGGCVAKLQGEKQIGERNEKTASCFMEI